MSIIYNNTEIENIIYNGNNIDTVNYNDTEVYVSTRTLTINIGSYITSIIINGTTYTSNTTLSIKPGTSVTLNCNVNSNSTSGSWSYTYSFVNWTGYSTNSNKSFTFTMPNQDITYTANGTYSRTFSWGSDPISEDTLLTAINNNIYDTNIVGKYVALTEDSTTHNWLIVRVNTDSYDLWYRGSIGSAQWSKFNIEWYSSSEKGYVPYLCNQYKSKLSSSIQTKLKTGLNNECSDTVVVLSILQLGYDNDRVWHDTNTAISYLNNKNIRGLGYYYWTSSARTGESNTLYTPASDGYGKAYHKIKSNLNVVPAIRVGK